LAVSGTLLRSSGTRFAPSPNCSSAHDQRDDQGGIVSTSEDGPRPGDPRSAGPRPPATGKDIGWVTLAVIVTGVTATQFVGLTLSLLRMEQRPEGGAVFLGFLITVVWLLTIWWVVMGAWRRTVWGCPFDHHADASEARSCPRHTHVTAPTVDEHDPGR
jgi:hypothetical protein